MIFHQSISIIGAGHLGGALIRGLIKHGYPNQLITASNRNLSKLKPLEEELGILSTTSNIAAMKEAEVVILAVKPQYMKDVCEEIAGHFQHKNPLIISLAGITDYASIALWLGRNDLSIVRVMTNTPMEFCRGMSALFANPHVTSEQKACCEQIFNAVGSSFWVDEELLLDPLTAAIGCAPAYVLLFMEALQKAAMSQNIPEKLAEKIAFEVVAGTVVLAEQSGRSFSDLRAGVTTSKGVTEYSLQQLSTDDFFATFKKVYQAAHERIEEIKST